VLFIVFDIEIALLFPWTLSLKTLNNFAYNSMFFFLIILILGFIFEWENDGLKWSKIKLN
jgi:NADH-quinone oxidoreductase subunit A